MSDTLKLEYKVGAIEFKAEGPSEIVEQQRINFMNTVLPAAVDAMMRTRATLVQDQDIDVEPQRPMLELDYASKSEAEDYPSGFDYSRTSLSAFLRQYGALTELDFTLFAARFDEVKNNTKAFSIDDVKRYYTEARRSIPKNPSALLYTLAGKGHIMDATTPEGAKPGKYYMLTNIGLNYINEYIPKDNGDRKSHVKTRKSSMKAHSAYTTINADDLNVDKYPIVKSLSGAKEQVIMTMFIVTNENKGEWFTVDDIIYLMINVFEVPADYDKVNGVFKRNKSMFASKKDEHNKKAYCHKLLAGAKNFAQSLINKDICCNYKYLCIKKD